MMVVPICPAKGVNVNVPVELPGVKLTDGFGISNVLLLKASTRSVWFFSF